VDDIFITIGSQGHYLWRAVDRDGEVLDIPVQKHRDKRSAKPFFRKLLKGLRYAPRRIVTDKLRSYDAARKEELPDVIHDNDKWQNNRAENSHQPTRQRERQMRYFNHRRKRNPFAPPTGPINKLFLVGRHHTKAAHERLSINSHVESYQLRSIRRFALAEFRGTTGR
jgi:putative transposase